MTFTYGSVCSGIESATVAWEPLGAQAQWFSEIEPFPSAVLAHHWPNIPNLGDMTQLPALIRAGVVPAPEVLVGGTPCQAFSVAGTRKGLADDRGQLSLTYVEVLDAIDEQRGRGDEGVCVWENVPGVLSSKDNAFGCFLASLCGEDEELKPPGKKWAYSGAVFGPQRAVGWRTLDAQYFGVAQRRRRVLVVASARAGFSPTAVLFESDGVRRDIAPSREAGQSVAARVGESAQNGNNSVTPYNWARGDKPLDYSPTLDARLADGPRRNQGGVTVLQAYGGNNTSGSVEIAAAVNAGGSPRLDFESETFLTCVDTRQDPQNYEEMAGPLSASHSAKPGQGCAPTILEGVIVRRLTPIECERLQGFPDNHTQIPWRKKPAEECPDGPRYKAIGNSKAVTKIRWLGNRLAKHLETLR